MLFGMASEQLLERVRAARELPSPARCREIREAAGESQANIAGEVGVHPETISRYESGTRRPRGEILVRYVALVHELERAMQ
jgi:transcriptional regulator with XRE-family HTH domain